MAEEKLNPPKEARAVVKYLKISPRKVRLVINTVRRKPVAQAISLLPLLNKKAARLVAKGLKSALANAKGKGLEETRLVVSEIKADGGPVMKRFLSRAMGRADEILKRSTHLTIILRESEKTFGPPPSSIQKQAGEAKARREKPKKRKVAAQSA